jgi:hypothetical protein
MVIHLLIKASAERYPAFVVSSHDAPRETGGGEATPSTLARGATTAD